MIFLKVTVYYNNYNFTLNTSKCKIPTVPEEGWFGQPKYSTPSKKFYVVSVSAFIFFNYIIVP